MIVMRRIYRKRKGSGRMIRKPKEDITDTVTAVGREKDNG